MTTCVISKFWKTRALAAAVTVLVTLTVQPFFTPVSADSLADVPADHWAYETIRELSEKGILIGLPGGTFRGNRTTSRLELAVVLFRSIDDDLGLKARAEVEDIEKLKKLAVEVAGDLDSLGVSMNWIKDELKTIRRSIEEDRVIISTHLSGADRFRGARNGDITITGDAWIHVDDVEYETDTVEDDKSTFYQLALNIAATVSEDVSTFVRIINDDLSGAGFGEEGMTGPYGIDLAFIDIRNLFGRGNLRIGRQFVAVGHSLTLDGKLDAVTYSQTFYRTDLTFVAADSEQNGINENGFNLKGVQARYPSGDHMAELFCFRNSTITGDPLSYGLALEGPFQEKVDYFFDYCRYDPDRADTRTGSAWLAGVVWDLNETFNVTAMFGVGDEEFEPINIYYWHRLNDMYGNIGVGNLPAGHTRATGSLKGIEDVFLKLDVKISEKLSACVVQERVAVNDNSAIVNNAFDYKRNTLGFDYQYAPNTQLRLRYDLVSFDETPANQLQDAGGWSRKRLELRVRF